MNYLANDICRCHDDGCPERNECLRYLLREAGSERTPHCASLYPYDQPLCEPCPMKIAKESK